jgi:hypothetical protein
MLNHTNHTPSLAPYLLPIQTHHLLSPSLPLSPSPPVIIEMEGPPSILSLFYQYMMMITVLVTVSVPLSVADESILTNSELERCVGTLVISRQGT